MRRHTVVTAVIASVAVSATMLTPFIFGLTTVGQKIDWKRLADIGQAYGAISAILSALAVFGVAISLIYQARAFRLTSLQALRSTLRELLWRIIDDPHTYAPAVGFKKWKDADMRPEQFYFITMFFGYMHTAFDAGIVDEKELREEFLGTFFESELGRKWWLEVGRSWFDSDDATSRRLGLIAKSEFDKAVKAGLALPPSAFAPEIIGQSHADISVKRSLSGKHVATFAGIFGAAAVTGWLASRTYKAGNMPSSVK